MAGSAVVAEISEATKITMSNAGSARNPTIISRRAPSVPKAVPMSIAASDRNTRAVASSPTSAIASAAIVNGSPVPIEGMITAATHHRAEHDVGRDAKQRRRVRGDHRVLVKELANAAIGQPQARGATVLQPCAALVDPADEQRCGGECGDQLQHLREDFDRLHSTSASSAISVTKLYSR